VTTEETNGDDRRRHPRAPLDLQVSLRFPSVQEFLSVYAGDISESGMFIRGADESTPRKLGDVVALRFDAGEERIVEGTARIVRVDAGKEPGIGVEFVELDPVSRKLI
jgi:c-di-GMP-binding flagellar brake protein YcgR